MEPIHSLRYSESWMRWIRLWLWLLHHSFICHELVHLWTHPNLSPIFSPLSPRGSLICIRKRSVTGKMGKSLLLCRRPLWLVPISWRPRRYGPSKGIKFGCWVGREYWQLRQFFVRYFGCIVSILVHGDNLFAVMTFSRRYILDRRNGLRKKLIINFPLIFQFQSDGIARSYTLASQYAKEAVKQINKLSSSSQRDALITITQQILQRRK